LQLLFAGADILAAWQIWQIGKLQHVSQSRCFWSIVLWLYNPFTVTISTRGSCDSLATVMLLAVLLLLMQGQRLLPALLYGLAVHFRIYPIVYAPAIVLYLAHRQLLQQQQQQQQKERQSKQQVGEQKVCLGPALRLAWCAGNAIVHQCDSVVVDGGIRYVKACAVMHMR
jgi:phosphatidylinositol glycan class M